MSQTFVKYLDNHNPNYKRFYEAVDNVSICDNCPGKTASGIHWSNVYKNILFKPVNTNWSVRNPNNITKVVICESPSNEETSYGVPTVGRTGQGIYKYFINQNLSDGWLSQLDEKVYRTNIVRCQADAGIKGNTLIKNKRVKEAWEFCTVHLSNELEKIFGTLEQGSVVKVYIAPGKSFGPQIIEIKEILDNLIERYDEIRVEVEVVNHFSSR